MYKHFLEHLEHREGNVDHVYLDTLDKPTCGVGHLLSAEENRQYALNEVVPETTRYQWLKEDAQKAWDAAAQQIQDLGIEDTGFIIALGSVNFQLGTRWMNKFPSAYKALSSKDYDEAIRQVSTGSGKYGQSKWKEQTPVRVEDFVGAIKNLT